MIRGAYKRRARTRLVFATFAIVLAYINTSGTGPDWYIIGLNRDRFCTEAT